MRDSVGHSSGCLESGFQSSREAVLEVACGIHILSLLGSLVSCSDCREKFDSEALCMGEDEKVISVC